MPATAKTVAVKDEETAAEPTPRTSIWEALVNLSIGRRNDKEKLADIVHKGETVTLTDEEAHGFLHRHKRPVIRPASEQNSAAPRIAARDLFGKPPGPPFGAREDPPVDPEATVFGLPLGANATGGGDPFTAPEANDPQPSIVDPDATEGK
jgi:hypothetical protein